MAKTTLVSVADGDDNRSTDLSPAGQEFAAEPIGENTFTTDGKSITLSLVAGFQNSLQKQGISQEAADVI